MSKYIGLGSQELSIKKLSIESYRKAEKNKGSNPRPKGKI